MSEDDLKSLQDEIDEVRTDNEELREDLILAKEIIGDLERGLERIGQVVDEVTRSLEKEKKKFKVNLK